MVQGGDVVRWTAAIILSVVALYGGGWYLRTSPGGSNYNITSKGLVAYYDARSLTASNGDMVASWADLTGKGHTAVQATDANKPTYNTSSINGRPSLQFNGSSRVLSAAYASDLQIALPFSVMAVIGPATSNSGYHMIAGRVGAWEAGQTSKFLNITSPSVDVYDTTKAWLDDGLPAVIQYDFNGSGTSLTSVDYYVNGALRETVTKTKTLANPASGALTIGAYNTSNYFFGSIGMLAVYNRRLTPAERRSNGKALCNQYQFYWINGDIDPNTAISSAASSPLTISSPTDSDSLIQPGLLDAGVSGFGGYRYWMAVTGYKNGDDTLERLLIFASSDGNSWAIPTGAGNPIKTSSRGAGFVFSDPSIFIAGGTMYVVFVDSKPSALTHEYVMYTASTDGVTWATPVDLVDVAGSSCSPLVTPQILTNSIKGRYEMFTTNKCVTPYRIERRVSSSMLSGWTAATVEVVQLRSTKALPATLNHCDLHFESGSYFGHCMLAAPGRSLNFVSSTDGLNFQLETSQNLVSYSTPAWQTYAVYKGGMVRTGVGTWDLWYTGASDSATWRIGRTTITGR